MKTKNIILLLGLVLTIFQSCIPSLHPLYTADKLVMKQELEGTWIDSDSPETDNLRFTEKGIPIPIDRSKDTPGVWIFEKSKNQSYTFTYYDEDGRPGHFEAHLIKLGSEYYLNFYPDNSFQFEDNSLNSNKFNSFEAFHYMPVNTFAKVTFESDGISIAMFDGDFLKKLLDQKRIRIKHEKLKDDSGYLLTAQPKELQQFILKYGDDEKAFPDPIKLNKPS